MEIDVSETESIDGDDVEIQYLSQTGSGDINDVSINDVKKQPAKKSQKEIDVKGSKGRKIRYLKIPKAVDFMFPSRIDYFTDVQRDNILSQMKDSMD